MSVLRGLAKSVFALGDVAGWRPAGPRVLIYHQIGTDHGHEMEVGAARFSAHLAWLQDEYEPTDLASAVARWTAPGSERLVVITFDDGYADVYTTAFPMLAERRIPFVLYLSTGLVGEPAGSGASPGEPLDWDQVGEMMQSGLATLGAHTHSHPDMRDLTTEEVEDELGTSDEIIERMTGMRPAHFAYPYGFWSETADPVVRRRYSTAVLGGTPHPAPDPDPHLLHRYPVQKSDAEIFFKARMRRGLRLEEAVRRRVKGYRGP